jgi:3-phenylpropionate/trans-cinnamate dioxygenase ferredoxin reductase subunit
VDSIAFIGAGVAGVTAIDELRAAGFDGRITLFSDEDRLPYDRPPLSKDVLLGTASDGVPLRPEAFYADNEVDLLLGQSVSELDCGARDLTTASGLRHRADAVVFATGGSARRLPLPGADLDGVHVLRTHEDAAELGRRLLPGARLVVVGGGFIGTEVAAAAVTCGLDVVLLEAAPAPLSAVLPELAPLVVEHHRRRGVRIRTEVVIESFTGDDRVTGVRLAGGETVPADVVVVGIGMRPNDELAARAGLATGNGVHVDEQLSTAVPGIYAIGDVACVGDHTGRRRCEHWSHAVDSGKRLADQVLGRNRRPPAVPWFWSDQYELNIQMVGSPGPADERVWRGDPGGDKATVVFHRGGRLTGAVALNNGRDIRPVSDLVASGATVAAAALQSPDTDLRKLAKQTLRQVR